MSSSEDVRVSTTLNEPKSRPMYTGASGVAVASPGHSTSTLMSYASAVSATGSVSTTPSSDSASVIWMLSVLAHAPGSRAWNVTAMLATSPGARKPEVGVTV